MTFTKTGPKRFRRTRRDTPEGGHSQWMGEAPALPERRKGQGRIDTAAAGRCIAEAGR